MATIRTASAVLLVLLVQGCVSPTPRFDRDFGASVRVNLAAQVANPAGAANPNPVNGVDGRAGRAAHERYEKSFAQPEPPAPTLISVGK